MLKILSIIFIEFVGISVIFAIRKNKLTIKYSLIWLFGVILLIIFFTVPNLLERFSEILGFQVVSNMILLLAILILFGIVFSLTMIISGQQEKIKRLIQETSILKRDIGELQKFSSRKAS